MSRKYEGLIALTTKNQEGSMDALVSAVSKDIEASGAKIEKIDNMGRKEFAYTPRKINGAHYVNYIFTGSPDCIAKIQEKLALNVSVYLNKFNRVA
ncbi:MAG: 30S ribosomal protein S6 [Akkermansiaceae bacterium]|jgi:small subunit ribosomal protein S6|nr:30S ribosomal protein S6 [Luteolibacter sp.]